MSTAIKNKTKIYLKNLHSDRWLPDLVRWSRYIAMFINIESLHWKPEANIILYIKYKKNKNIQSALLYLLKKNCSTHVIPPLRSFLCLLNSLRIKSKSLSWLLRTYSVWSWLPLWSHHPPLSSITELQAPGLSCTCFFKTSLCLRTLHFCFTCLVRLSPDPRTSYTSFKS